MRISIFALSLLVFTACPEAEQKRQEVINKVGGAPKAKVDEITKKANAAIKKGVARTEKELGTTVKMKGKPKADKGGW